MSVSSTLTALAMQAGGHFFVLYNRCRLISSVYCLEESVLHHFACKFHWKVTQLASHDLPQPGSAHQFPWHSPSTHCTYLHRAQFLGAQCPTTVF